MRAGCILDLAIFWLSSCLCGAEGAVGMRVSWDRTVQVRTPCARPS